MASTTDSQVATATATRSQAASPLTDEMLARFAARAATYDRENAFFTEDFEELRTPAICASPCRPSSADSAFARRRRSASSAASATTPPPTALAINMHLYWTGVAADLWRAGDTSLTWLLEAAAARRGVRRRPRRERQRHPGAALDHQGRARRRRLPLHRPQVVRQPVAGLDVPRHPRHGHRRIRPARRSSTRSCRATPRAIASRRPGTSLGMRATRSDDTILEGAFVPDRYVVAGRAGRAPPASTRSCSGSSRGRCSASATSTTGWRGARST